MYTRRGYVAFVASFLLLTSVLVVSGESEVKSYEGYKLLRTSPLQDGQAKELFSSFDAVSGVHFWTQPRNQAKTDVLVSPAMLHKLTGVLNNLNIEHRVVHENIAKLIEAERPVSAKGAQARASGHKMDWESYHSYEDIYGYCKYLATTYAQDPSPSGALVTLETIGYTTEKRQMVVVRISSGNQPGKKAIWLEAGIHAREWISPATLTFILETLVMSQESAALLGAFDWYVVPVINIDGYEYTRKFDRMWRKTRSWNWSILCRGTDPNRNFAANWGGAGASPFPCSETYRGPKAFSEPETKAVSDAILRRKNSIALYIGFHSYSQLILVPWSGKKDKPDDYPELKRVAVAGKEALQVPFGTEYTVGTAPDLLYVASGGADDWAKAKDGAGIKYAYTLELRDKGDKGFILPPDQIIPSGIETFDGVKAMALAVLNA